MVEGCVFGCGFKSVKQSDAPLPRKRLPDSMVWHVEPPLKYHVFEKKSAEKSPKRKTILTMVLRQKWRFSTFNKFFLRIFKLIANKEYRGITILKKKKVSRIKLLVNIIILKKKVVKNRQNEKLF